MKRLLLGMGVLVVPACAHRSAPAIEQLPPPAPISQRDGIGLPATASLWRQEPESLFGNRRARVVGDILTVIVEIDEEAELKNEVDRDRTSSDSFDMSALFGLPEYAANTLPGGATLTPGVDLNRQRQFSGSGQIRRQDKVTLRLAARVVEQLPNGYLVIRGQQSVRVNYEERILRAEGIVRPEDISRSNTIPHDRIADARIGYVGRGAIDRSVKPGWGTRLLDTVIPF
ncbi:flagellar basal body L-ring protein FlgH [Parvularcula sp. LCG005]|uniref:flagellar basal body L-ring protein FlgH n=1 Tax=Parvularcula sp. LCG005 TaxID=3078805 RepID=UPI0029438F91|nr:flagellar basal body L-ring protein FlgH [Parvularcula sp. LCG005]WOI52955.1 flagellar basal body L-ring protein FlgH [Parvularcula sp. LCG005]